MTETIIGIDKSAGNLKVARTEDTAGRVSIIGLDIIKNKKSPEINKGKTSFVSFAVPDNFIIMKRFNMESGDSETLQQRLLFEMEQSLIDDSRLFQFQFHSIENSNFHLGLAIREKKVTEFIESCNLTNGSTPEKILFRSRALAMGLAYLAYCQIEQGDLITLVDITTSGVSVCVVHQRQIVDIGYMPLNLSYPLTEKGNDKLAVDLKTFIGFRLSTLTHLRLSVPLTSVLMTGTEIDDSARLALLKYFPSGVDRPRIQKGYLSDKVKLDEESLSRFIVALGLTVN